MYSHYTQVAYGKQVAIEMAGTRAWTGPKPTDVDALARYPIWPPVWAGAETTRKPRREFHSATGAVAAIPGERVCMHLDHGALDRTGVQRVRFPLALPTIHLIPLGLRLGAKVPKTSHDIRG